MGNSTSVATKVEHKIWPKGISHEMFTQSNNRERALATRQVGEYFSFGITSKERVVRRFGNDFELIDKGTLLDGKRKVHKDVPQCCTSNATQGVIDGVRFSCSNGTKTYSNTTCDKIMLKAFNDIIASGEKGGSQLKDKVHIWIKAVVTRRGPVFKELLARLSLENIRGHEFTATFFEALRSQDEGTVVDTIINNYPEEIREAEFKCAYPPEYILEQEIKTQTPRECWWRECALSPVHKLLSENIAKRNLCNITVCDININQLEMSTQDIKIICKNKFDNHMVDLSDTPVSQDIENIFFVPSFRNTVLPFYIIFMACFMFNK